MAEIRVKGTGTIKLFENDNTSSVTIASPASLGGDRTITLPDADVTLVSGTMATTNGITVADQWRLTTTFAGDAEPIASNLERIDTTGMGTIGSAMTESSGIFTFPSTGIYKVEFVASFALTAADSRYNIGRIQGTTNDSSYAEWGDQRTVLYDSGGASYSSCYGCVLVDVTDVSNVKVRFDSVVEDDNTSTRGNTDTNETFMTFTRLGDT